jgi:hypothetical protein
MSRNFRLLGIVILFAVMSGCASFPVQKSARPQASLGSAGTLKFEDVPVPQGFSLLANESFIFQTDTMRVGLLKYSGRPAADQVVSFYKEQMAQFGWSMINVVEYGRRILNFDSEDQSCVITVEPATTKTIVIISVAPKSKGLPPSNYKSEDSGKHTK